jgi:hypothetical protein
MPNLLAGKYVPGQVRVLAILQSTSTIEIVKPFVIVYFTTKTLPNFFLAFNIPTDNR